MGQCEEGGQRESEWMVGQWLRNWKGGSVRGGWAERESEWMVGQWCRGRVG